MQRAVNRAVNEQRNRGPVPDRGKVVPVADEQTVAEGLPKAFREALRMKRDAEVTVEDCDLWDMPLLFILLVVALGFEWWLRRHQGLS